mgnify:CR=1 FL=1
MRTGSIVIAVACSCQTLPAASSWIELNPDCRTALRERGTGRPFMAVGVNYFDPHVGWAPKLWQQFDEQKVRRHLRMVSEQGFNTIRVFLTLQSFHRDPGEVCPEGEALFRRLLAICRELDLRVIPSGPDHWEGMPSWRVSADDGRGLPDWLRTDPFADETVLAADEAWWKAFAGRFAECPTILAWDVLNEPAVPWNSPHMKPRWNRWLQAEYGSTEAVARAWGLPADQVGPWGSIEHPPAVAARGDQRLYDYQRFRTSLGGAWARRMVEAIRQADRGHMVTIGHVQWAVPVYLESVAQYAGIDARATAGDVDFVSVHFYPLAMPRVCQSPEGTLANRVYLETLLQYCSTGKPLMLGEFGWYGGGGIGQAPDWALPPAPMENQVCWGRQLLSVSRGRVCGLLNWAYADTPASNDLSRHSGCWTADLELKPWGAEFGAFARSASRACEPVRPFDAGREAQRPDLRDLLTDPGVGHAWLRKLIDRLAGASRPAP